MKTSRSYYSLISFFLVLLMTGTAWSYQFRWQVAATVPALKRADFTLTEFQNQLWVIGGFPVDASAPPIPGLLHSSDGISWQAVSLPPSLGDRGQHATVVFQGALYVIGGVTQAGAVLSDVWRSTDGLSWNQVQANAAFGARQGHAAAVLNGAIWLIGGMNAYQDPYIGGQGPDGPFADAWVSYDGTGWMQVQAPEFPPRRFHSMTSHEGALWVVGGEKWNGTIWVKEQQVNYGPVVGGRWLEDEQMFFVDKAPGYSTSLHAPIQGLVSQNGALYAFSWYSYQNPGTVGVGFGASVKTNLGLWEMVPFQTNPSYQAHAGGRFAILNGKFLLVGGRDIGQVSVANPYYKLTLDSPHGSVDYTVDGVSILSPDGFYPAGLGGGLVPIPDPGYIFTGWSVDAQGSAIPQALYMDRDKTVVALFNPANPLITVTIAGAGTVTPGPNVNVARGGNQSFTLRPSPGSRIVDVLIDGVSSGPLDLYTFSNVSDNHTLHAVFAGCPDRAPLMPGYVAVRSYSLQAGAPVTRYLVPDGFGSDAQTQLDMGSGAFLLSGNSQDGMGVVTKDIKPYVAEARPAFQYEEMACEKMVVQAGAYYNGASDERPDAQGYAFTETRYAQEPLMRAEAGGLPGKPFSLDPAAGHGARIWRFGVASASAYVPSAQLNDALLDARPSTDNANYQLVVLKDGNGNFSQLMRDGFGNTVGRWGNPLPGDDAQKVVSQTQFDILGGVTQDVPPLGAAYQSSYDVTWGGESLSDTTPDGGLVEYRHDAAGRMRFVRSARHKALDVSDPTKTHYLVLSYDALDRLVALGENRSNHSFDSPETPITAAQGDSVIRKRVYFDTLRLSDLQALGLGASAQAITAVAAEAKVRTGQLAMAASLAADGSKTADVFSYDPRGFLIGYYRFLPGGAPVQKLVFTYDLEGKVVKEDYYNGYNGSWTLANQRESYYDPLQRLSQIKVGGQTRFGFDYQKNNLLAKERLYMPGQAQPLEELSRTYTIQDWVRRITTPGATPKYRNELDYSGLFNGNVSKANFGYQLTSTTRKDLEYRYGYDGMDRLVEAQTPADPDFAAYNYDSQGRLTYKKEGTNEIPQYAYVAGKNQLINLPGHSNPIKAGANNYVYDPEGNLVLDRSKNMVIDYDYQGLPVAFRTYNSMPTQTLTWLDVQNNRLATNFGKIQTERVEMVYDPFGQRTLKKRVVGTAETWTAYVGEFSELTAASSAGPWTLSSVNHWTPMGLRGRRETGGAEFLYLTDAQGSVRMGLNSSGAVVDARDYRPYGQPEVFVGGAAGKSRQGYTEKELDGETGLTYYGVRYLDAEVGAWVSPDPIAEFHSPYNFVGGDPVNSIDRDGLERFDIVANAYISTATAEGPFGTYRGDNRSAGQPGTFRVSTHLVVETDPEVAPEGPLVHAFTRQGETKNLRTGERATGIPKASIAAYRISKNSNSAVVHLKGRASDPLATPKSLRVMNFLTPAVDFDLTFNLSPGKIEIEGGHDRYPSYEIFVDGKLTYAFEAPKSSMGSVALGLLGYNPVTVSSVGPPTSANVQSSTSTVYVGGVTHTSQGSKGATTTTTEPVGHFTGPKGP